MIDSGMNLVPLFQSTPPRGGRRGPRGPRLRRVAVSIHAPAWGATADAPRPPCGDEVSIHAPAWGATSAPTTSSGSLWFQSTPPRGGRPEERIRDRGREIVSIHAPAWGATLRFVTPDIEHDVSIHAPAWGATSAAE